MTHQLLNDPRSFDEAFLNELYEHMKTKSGQEKADNFDFLWDLFANHVQKLARTTIVIDALDECEQSAAFLSSILQDLSASDVKFIILSRREIELIKLLDHHPQIRFSHEENKSDILAYLQAEISKHPRLSSESVRKRVHKRYHMNLAEVLNSRANGSFMWATSALRELDRKATASEIIVALRGLPSGLTELYTAILKDYNKRLDPTERRFCSMILRWLICAARPLSSNELWAAVKNEYLLSLPGVCSNETTEYDSNEESIYDSNNESDNDSSDDFLFSPSEIEIMCGSLVTVTDEKVQLAHLSIAEFLRCGPPNMGESKIGDFFVDVPSANMHLTSVCVEYLDRSLGDPPIQLADRGRKVQPNEASYPQAFSEYCIRHWLFHLTHGSKANLDILEALLRRFLLRPKMLYWLELWIVIEDQEIWEIQHNLRTVRDWCIGGENDKHNSLSKGAAKLVRQWSQGTCQLLERHGSILKGKPSEIHFIDPHSYIDSREGTSIFDEFQSPDPPLHIPHIQLKSDIFSSYPEFRKATDSPRRLELPRDDSPQMTMFYAEKGRNFIIAASYYTMLPTLRCYDAKTGRLFKPTRLICQYDDRRAFYCEGYTVSPNGEFLAVLYCSSILQEGAETATRYDINIWHLANLGRVSDLVDKRWCEIAAVVTFDSCSVGHAHRPLAIDSKDRLYCPWGFTKLPVSQLGTANDAAETTLKISKFPYTDREANLSCRGFSSDCRYMIAFDAPNACIARFHLMDMTRQSLATVNARDIMICCISDSGRFVVWREMYTTEHSCFLLDFALNKCIRIPGSAEVSFPAYVNLQFTSDEEYLVGNMGKLTASGRPVLSVWTCLTAQTIQQNTSPVLPPVMGFHITSIDELGLIVTDEGWTEFRLSDLSQIAQSLDLNRSERPCIESRLSQNGNQIAVICVNTHMYVKSWSLDFTLAIKFTEVDWGKC